MVGKIIGGVLQITFRNQGIGTYKKKLDSWNEVIERLKKIFMKTGKSSGHLLAGLRR